jgi:hypothetical protein
MMHHNCMLQQYMWEWTLPSTPFSFFGTSVSEYGVKLDILYDWARAMQNLLDNRRVDNRRLRKMVRKFYLACLSIADFSYLCDRPPSKLGEIRAAFLRSRGLLRVGVTK